MPKRYSAKDPEEVELYSLDFAGRLSTGETLTTPFAVTVSTSEGADASSMLDGAATQSGTVVQQSITGGTDAVDYLIRFETTTSAGRYLVEVARLPVRTATVA